MTDSTMPSLTRLAAALAPTFPCCDDAPLARDLLRMLGRGAGVPPERLAAFAGREEAEVRSALRRWPNVHLDEQDQVIAFGGLSLRPTTHRLDVGGRRLYTWCAWDTLFLPAVLGRQARVGSTCPVTRADVALTAAPDGVTDPEPDDLWVSFPSPARTATEDITGSFCCHVHFLAGEPAAERWRAGHDGGLTLTLEDAYELGRLATQTFDT
jgi:alkylmercury lyase